MEITREKFIEKVGYEPTNDDLDRCNCPKAGEFGHKFCGWNYVKDCPAFVCPTD